METPEYITVDSACRIIGGEERPIDRSTYYRGVQDGRYPAPEHPSPGIARIDKTRLLRALRPAAPRKLRKRVA
jgi:hypothetical protein